MEFRINPNASHCPLCKMEKTHYKEIGKPLCRYCYFITSGIGIVKMFTLLVMSELDSHGTVNEIAEKMTNHKLNQLNGKPRRIFSPDTVRHNVAAYSEKGYSLLSRKKPPIRKTRRGRPPNLYKITKKGRNFLKKYISRFERGHGCVIPNHFAKKHYRPWALRTEQLYGKNRLKARMIKKDEIWKYLFSDTFKNYWNVTEPTFCTVRG